MCVLSKWRLLPPRPTPLPPMTKYLPQCGQLDGTSSVCDCRRSIDGAALLTSLFAYEAARTLAQFADIGLPLLPLPLLLPLLLSASAFALTAAVAAPADGVGADFGRTRGLGRNLPHSLLPVTGSTLRCRARSRGVDPSV